MTRNYSGALLKSRADSGKKLQINDKMLINEKKLALIR